MDAVTVAALRELLRTQTVAALGTLHRGHAGVEPFVSMLPVVWPAAALYLARFPQAEPTFALGDFMLVRLRPRSLRFVAGFGRAHSLGAAAFAALVAAG